METDRIICGKTPEAISDIPDESVDLIVTDPPYGMSFMGKAWDKALPSVDVWRECLRVLKPGAFAFVMCIPRQDCLSRMIINLEDAGFMVNFSPIYHTFATGFPKSANLSKLVDRRLGVEREIVGTKKLNMRDTKTYIPAEGGGYHGVQSSPESGMSITIPATPEAKALEGAYAGLQMKPAIEAVLTAMKPLTEKTYLDQALANGHGCTHLDAGRIPYEGQADMMKNRRPNLYDKHYEPQGSSLRPHNAGGHEPPQPQGRFAPNLLCSDDVLNDGSNHKSGGPYTGGKNFMFGKSSGYSGGSGEGSYSRYFSLDAWSEANLPDSVKRTFPFLIVPKASKREKNAGLDGLDEKAKLTLGHYSSAGKGNRTQPKSGSPQKNHHPCCKPIKLMSYLIAIGSRPGDVILDPFAGSGTTGIAAALLDRRYILIEMDAEYVDIAERRITWHVEQAKEEQLKLDFP